MTATSGVHLKWFDFDIVCLHDGELEDAEGSVEAWEDHEAGLWGFTCHCGKEIEHDIRSAAERGAVPILTAVFLAGFALVCVGLCILSALLILIGFALMLPTPTIGVLAILNRKEDDHV